MVPFNLNPRAEALRWLDIAEKLLSTRDLVGSKTFAARARESDPRLEHADLILAIADTLLAGENQIGNHQLDWYAILQLARLTHDSELIAAQYRRLALLLNPNRNKFAFAEHAFKLVSEAWLVLSNPSRKFQFDNEIGNSNTHFNFIQQHHEPQQEVGNGTHFSFIQEHHEPQLNNSTHFNFIQEHREQHHQSLPLQQQQQFLPPFPLQQTLPQQQSQTLNLQQLHETTIASPTSTHSAQQPLPRPHPQQPLPWPQPQEPLIRPQPQQLLLQSHLQPQQFLSRPQSQPQFLSRPQPQPHQPLTQPQPQPSPQPQPRQPSPQPQPQRPSPQPQPQRPSPQPQPQPQQPSPQPQPQPQPQQPSPQPQQPSPQPQPQRPSPQPQPQRPSPQPQPQQPSPQPQPQQPSPQPQPHQPSPQPQPHQPSPQPQLQEQGKSGNLRKDNSNLTEEEGGDNDDYAKNDLNGKESSSFWTACPYCYNMYEYHRAYAECTLRCQNCKRAFHAVIIADPPLISEGKDVSFCCWVNFPFGVSMSYLEKNKKGGSNWTPFSTMFACPLGESSANVCRQKNARKSSGPRIYIDDDHEVFVTLSSSDDSDDEWGSTRKKKKAISVKGQGQGQGRSQEFFSRRRQT